MKRASISIACIIVSIVLVQLPLRAQAPQQKRIASSTGQIVKLKRSPASLVMAKAFSEGKLPEQLAYRVAEYAIPMAA